MYLVTAKEMRALDRHTIETIGIPSPVLMENAGKAVACHAAGLSGGGRNRPFRWAILIGKGNNGGDGIVAARHLKEQGIESDLIAVDPLSAFSGDAALQMGIIRHWDIPLQFYQPGLLHWNKYDGIIDALLGTGAAGAPRGAYADLIREANASGLPIIAVDIPSGLDADSGCVHDPCIKAAKTIALAVMKRGLAVHPGAAFAGETIVEPIGIPERLCELFSVKTYLADTRLLSARFGIELPIARMENTHKGTYGHALVAAGSRSMSGAGVLCAKAALRTGSGLVTWAVPKAVAGHLTGIVPEVMIMGMDDQQTGRWSAGTLSQLIKLSEGKSALAVGPGMGRFEDDGKWLKKLWEQTDCPLVLDADALNMLSDDPAFPAWKPRKSPVVITPHPGEMARLTGCSIGDIQQNRLEAARRYAEQHGVTVVLKGSRTVTATPQGAAYINTTGNPGMATAGAGDVLAGMIASLLGQGFDAERAAVLGVYLHGAAGDRAAGKRSSPGSLLATDLIEEL